MPNDRSYAVGKGRPPKSTQFKPGQSGNYKGRPKGSKNTKTILLEELNAPVIVNENGKRKRITMQRSMIKQLVHKSASGNEKTATIVLNELRKYEEGDHSGQPQEPLGPSDEIVIAQIVRRIRLSDELPQNSPALEDGNSDTRQDAQEDQT